MQQHPTLQLVDDTVCPTSGGYGREVEIAAISGDGRRALTVHAVGVAEVWDARSGQKLGEVRPESPLQGAGTTHFGSEFSVFIESAALSRDGSIALLGLNDGTAGTFRVSDGVQLATLHPPGEPPASRWSVVRAVAYSADGSFALVGFPDRAVGVWSAHGDQFVAFLVSPAGSKLVGKPSLRDTMVSSLAMSVDNRWVFAGSVDMTAAIWDMRTKQAVFAATEHAEELLGLFDNAEGFGWATTAGTVWCSRAHAAPTKAFSSGEHWAEALFHGRSLLTRSFENEIKRWDLSGQGISLFAQGPNPTLRARVGPTVKTLVAHDGWILYLQTRTRAAVCRGTESLVIERDARAWNSCFWPTGSAIASPGGKGNIELWSIPDGSLIRTFPAPDGGWSLAFSSDGALIAIGEAGIYEDEHARHVVIYETASGRELHRHSEHNCPVSRIELSPGNRYLATLGIDIVLWDLHHHRVIAHIEIDHSYGPGVSPDFRFLSDGRLLVLDDERARVFQEGRQILEWKVPVDFGMHWCVSEDGRTLSVAVNQSIVRFDLETGLARGIWAAPMPRPESVPGRPLALQVGARAGADLWRTEQGIFLHQGDAPRGWIQPLHLSPDGILAIPAQDGAAVMRVGAEVSLLGIVPFEGTLRASCVVDGELLLVNERGQLFRHQLPGAEPGSSSDT